MDNFEEENIRAPDEIVNEQIMEDTRSDFEKQIDEAIYVSTLEMNQYKYSITQYEEQVCKDYTDELDRRTLLFKEFLFNLNKIGKFDKESREIYDIIEPIIESYCGQFIQSCELDEKTYDKIFNTLTKIRNNKIAFNTLKTIILKE
jgi:hypothetical protein